MSEQQFYNGELAYDLNNFYLYKRYSDHITHSGTPLSYTYYEADATGKLQKKTGKYSDNITYCSSGYNGIKYVEERFADGDFRYAAGEIPETEDERQYKDPEDETKVSFLPIWPDDYIFFGQKLTYGWAVEAHDTVPKAVTRNEGRLSLLSDANRVYRAPAYFRSKDMSFIHFNPQAYLAQKSSNGTKEAYPGLTAIDFAGHNGANEVNGTYGLGLVDSKFYPPLLDDDGLLSITNCDETQNLLVYAPAETSTSGYANKTTYGVLTGYFTDPAFSSYDSNPTTYRTVADASPASSSVYGHLVKATLTDGRLTATNDHLLVDKQDFNCPIAYTFDGSHRMWYQRKPEDHEYVDHTKGWQGISIPFTAELVTTDDKGEITHFYNTDDPLQNSKNGTKTKIGHEYWLRELNGIVAAKEGTPEVEVVKASFLYPNATGTTKTVTNHFLWDYYYEKSERKDANSDIYQEYYRFDRTYFGYPRLAGATPYIIGFPGKTYYEFDLSGNFEAKNTYATIDKLGKQTITFASNTGAKIGVSDDETAGIQKSVTGSDKKFTLTFKPSYMNSSLEANTYSYALDAAGDSYDKVSAEGAATKVSAFRPYFVATSEAKPAGSRKMMPERIVFSSDYDGLEGELESALDGDLEIYAKGHAIITTSHLKRATTVRILNISGITLANYVLQPGETIETRVNLGGVYIVQTTDAGYTKKLAVK